MIDGSVQEIFGPLFTSTFPLGLFDQSLLLIPTSQRPNLKKKKKEVNGSTATQQWLPSIQAQASDGPSDPAKSGRAVPHRRGHRSVQYVLLPPGWLFRSPPFFISRSRSSRRPHSILCVLEHTNSTIHSNLLHGGRDGGADGACLQAW